MCGLGDSLMGMAVYVCVYGCLAVRGGKEGS